MMGNSLCEEASLTEQGVQNLDKLELVGGSSSSVGSARPPAAHVPLRAPGRTAAPPGRAELRPREPIRAPPSRRAAPSGLAELRPSSASFAGGGGDGGGGGYRSAGSRDASPKPPYGGGGGGDGGSAPLAAALRTLDAVVADLDTMDSQARHTKCNHSKCSHRIRRTEKRPV